MYEYIEYALVVVEFGLHGCTLSFWEHKQWMLQLDIWYVSAKVAVFLYRLHEILTAWHMHEPSYPRGYQGLTNCTISPCEHNHWKLKICQFFAAMNGFCWLYVSSYDIGHEWTYIFQRWIVYLLTVRKFISHEWIY